MIDAKGKFQELVVDLYQRKRDCEDNTAAWVLVLKLQEELGELSEAVLKEYGYLRHKELKERPIDEMADIINVVIGLHAVLNPLKSAEKLTEELYEAISRKGDKYYKVIARQKERK